jgi:hypothetical protein
MSKMKDRKRQKVWKWVDGWADGRMNVKTVLNVACSNLKYYY